MSNDHIATYLNDHLSGSVVAVELMENLESVYADSPIASFIAGLRVEIEADVQVLKDIMSRLEISESSTRKASAWLTEKVTQIKLRLDDPDHGQLRLFESLEALSLGIEGKKSLWLALSAAAKVTPGLQLADYEGLMQKAEDQRNRVEVKRLEAAKAALKLE